jgi:hypothetical protein
VRAFGELEGAEDGADPVPKCADGSLGGFAQDDLELGEGVLDRMKSGL